MLNIFDADDCAEFLAPLHVPECMFVLVQERKGRFIRAVDVVDAPERGRRDNRSKHSSAAGDTQPLCFSLLCVFCDSLLSCLLSLLLLSFTVFSPSSQPLSSRHDFPASLPRCVSVSPPLFLSPLSSSSPLLRCPPRSPSPLSLSIYLSGVLSFGYSSGFAV